MTCAKRDSLRRDHKTKALLGTACAHQNSTKVCIYMCIYLYTSSHRVSLECSRRRMNRDLKLVNARAKYIHTQYQPSTRESYESNEIGYTNTLYARPVSHVTRPGSNFRERASLSSSHRYSPAAFHPPGLLQSHRHRMASALDHQRCTPPEQRLAARLQAFP